MRFQFRIQRAWKMLLVAALTISTLQANAEDLTLKSAGPIAFGPDGLLLVSDPMEAMVYAIETGDTEGSTDGVTVELEDVRSKVASMMGAKADDVRINDLAVNPINGHPYLSVTRGSGEKEMSTILMVDPKTKKISEVDFKGKKFTKAELSNAAENKQTRRGNQRMMSITDIAFIESQVYIAGLSNEELASNLRACLLYTSPSPRDATLSRMPSSA